MQRLFAIIWLTWKAAFRFKLFWVVGVLLLVTVVGLPLVIKHDGTARGFTQILLTYTLGMITTLLGLITLWVACGTLARDVEECQIQMVAVKPISRWQIWLGKWLGIMLVNLVLLAVAGGSVYVLLKWRAARLDAKERKILQDEIFVARGSLREEAVDIHPDVERLFQERLKRVGPGEVDLKLLRQQVTEQVQAEYQIVRPGQPRRWRINLGLLKDSLRDQPLFIRTKFNAAQTNSSGTYRAIWQIGPPETGKVQEREMSLAADTFHEFPIPPNLYDEKGVLTIDFINFNDTALLFSLNDGLEVLYRESGFGLNFVRGLGIVLCWLAVLAALGLTAATFLSFPVAAFLALGILVLGLSTGTMQTAVSEGTILGWDAKAEGPTQSWLNALFLPVFKVILKVFNLMQGFSPIDSLSTGRSITWGQLGLAFAENVLLLGGLIGLIGICIFQRRELATAQGTV